MIYLVNVFNLFFSHHALNCCEAAEILSTRIPDTFSLCVDISTAVKKAQQWQHFLVYFYRPSIKSKFVHSSLCYTSLKTSSHRFFFWFVCFSPLTEIHGLIGQYFL